MYQMVQSLLKKKGFKEERMTKVGVCAIDKSTTLESNKSLRGCLPDPQSEGRADFCRAPPYRLKSLTARAPPQTGHQSQTQTGRMGSSLSRPGFNRVT